MRKSKFPREVYIEAGQPDNFSITIFLGIFNGSDYLVSMKEQLLHQTNQDFHLVVVDNNSTDNSFLLLKEWKSDFPNRITIARNTLNLGGSGTLLNSLDLIQTTWFAAFHQDDNYGPKHIEVLVSGIHDSDRDVVAVSTVMGSMDGNGKILGTVPRASMFAKSNDSFSAFLQNLRTHSVPWPASAFKLTIFEKTFAPWHSTAFPDTEQILRMCAYGRFLTINEETMYYRENAKSESHSINSSESLLGTALSLSRVFTSSEFDSLATRLKPEETKPFVLGLIDAIDFRLRGSVFGGFLSLIAIESLLNKFEYKNDEILLLAGSIYGDLNLKYSSELFFRLASPAEANTSSRAKPNLRSINLLLSYLESSEPGQLSNIGGLSQLFNNRPFQYLPFSLKQYVFKVLIAISHALGRSKQFKFDWR